MASIDRERWNQRFRAGENQSAPDSWLVDHADLLVPMHAGARALDLACGAGRHSLWLAELGYAVDAWDISDVGLELLDHELERRRSAAAPLRVTPRQLDLESASIPADTYDLILDAFFLERRLFGPMIAALRPGGVLVVRTLLRRQAGDDRNPAYLLAPGELRAALAQLEIADEAEDQTEGLASSIARRNM